MKGEKDFCPDCWAYNIQPDHICPSWLKQAVKDYNERTNNLTKNNGKQQI